MYRSIISLSKIAHQSSCGTITHSAKETRQQKEQLRWGWRRQKIGGVGQNFDKGSRGGAVGVRQYSGGLCILAKTSIFPYSFSLCIVRSAKRQTYPSSFPQE